MCGFTVDIPYVMVTLLECGKMHNANHVCALLVLQCKIQ